MRTRVLVVGLVATVAVLALAAPASAHVSVNPSEAPQGGFTKLTFRVPNESDTASTTSVEVNLPTDALIRSVRYKPQPGWTATVETRVLEEPLETEGGEVTEVVSKITWTGGEIGPGEFQEFDVSVGPLPIDVDTLEFPSIQTYSDGDIVRWIEEVPEGGEEPERPAPTLTLVPADAEGDGHGGGAEADEAAAAADADAAASPSDSDDDSNVLSIVALVVGGVGVLLGGLALIRRRPAA